MFLPRGDEISVADKAPQSVRRKIETTDGIDEVENSALGAS
jgi:hypothetical protein